MASPPVGSPMCVCVCVYIEDSANRSFCATHPMAVLVQLRAQECYMYQRVSAITARLMAMKQLRRDNTVAGPRRCRSPPIVTTVVEGERRSPGSSSWRSSIRELPSLSQAGTGSRTMAPRGWRQRRKAWWSGEAILRNFEARENPTALQNQVYATFVNHTMRVRRLKVTRHHVCVFVIAGARFL